MISASTEIPDTTAGASSGFWLQVGYYSSSHWREQPARLLAHVTLLILYGGFATTYLCAAS